MNLQYVLKKPIISEKSTKSRENLNQYTFAVDLKASKEDVNRAIQEMYGVKVAKIQTLITRGKVRRRGVQVSLGSKKKKAIITLVDGAKLPLFEEQ